MKQQKNTRSGLFLTELMIAVLFFALGSAVCIQVFVKAYTVNQDARCLSFASLEVSGAASAVKYTDGSPASLKKYFPMLTEEADELVIYYDKKFRECEKSKGFFAMHISVSQEGSVNHAHIRVTAPDRTEDIYSLSLRYPASARPVSSEKERTGDVS